MLNSHVERINTEAVVLADSDGTTTLQNDYVFVLIGGEPPEGFL
jgi:thioredoxin reductase